MFSESATFLKIAADFWESAVSLRPLACAIREYANVDPTMPVPMMTILGELVF